MHASKGFSDQIEKWLARLPGVRTYRAREHRRETDKRLREHLASLLTEAKGDLRRICIELTQKGQLAHLDDLDRLAGHIQQLADTIRYASYGYSGIFDLEKIREDELDRLYAFDLSLMDDIDKIRARVSDLDWKVPAEALREAVRETDAYLIGMEGKFKQRNSFLSQVA
jgi:hypothetical protein